jgi:phage terminase large subunit
MIDIEVNRPYAPLYDEELTASVIDVAGGRARGGSHAITQLFLDKITEHKYFRGYFMRLIHGDIRNSLWQDFKDRIEEIGFNEYDFDFNESRMEVTYLPTGNKILSKGFKKSSGTQTAKLKSIAGATDIVIEECEEISEDDFNKLADSLRTAKAPIHIFRIWNPPSKDHWLIKNYYEIVEHEEFKDYFRFYPKGVKGHLAIISNYKDNINNINQDAIDRFEGYRHTNLDHYCTNVLGLVSTGVKGQIYKNWERFETLPERNYYRVLGLDFGYDNDPTALTECLIDGDRQEVYVYEHFYSTHTMNRDLIRYMKSAVHPGGDEIIADNGESEQVTEMLMAGLNTIKTKKGGKYGNKFKQVNNVKQYKVYYHTSCKNLPNEVNNYRWAINPDTKEPMNKPVDGNDHLLDSILYAINYYHRNYGITNQDQ